MLNRVNTPRPEMILSVYFSGTNHGKDDMSMLAGYLYNFTETRGNHARIGFDGCQLTHGVSGALFGTGLNEQCDEVIAKIKKYHKEGFKVTLNAYGHSRGGIAALLLAKRLGQVSPDFLTVNLALMDPVPGNLLLSANLDIFEATLANQSLDISNSKNLANVLCLYPSKPIPDFLFHAPVFPTYPLNCNVDEEVITGCHVNAQRTHALANTASQISRLRVMQFMKKHGTSLAFDMSDAVIKATLLDAYREENSLLDLYTREGHSIEGKRIVSRRAAYLNLNHKRLSQGNPQATDENCALKIEPTPTYRKIAKWLLLGAITTGIIYLSGGFALPFIVPIAAKLGILTLPAALPVISLVTYGLCKYVIKPAAKFLKSCFAETPYNFRPPQSPSKPFISTDAAVSKMPRIVEELPPYSPEIVLTDKASNSPVVQRRSILDEPVVTELPSPRRP